MRADINNLLDKADTRTLRLVLLLLRALVGGE